MSALPQLTAHTLARLLGDWRDPPGPLYVRLTGRLGQLVADGRVAAGVGLPAERRLAGELGVSRTTVTRAYQLMREQGLMESRRGAGSVTRLSAPAVERFVPWAGGTRLGPFNASAIDLTKASPEADDRVISALKKAAGQASLLFGDDGYYPLGLEALRSAIATRYELRGLPTEPAQILITAGAQQAIDLLARALIRRRDAVVVESPTYPGAMDSLRLAGARMVSLDVATEPWDLEALDALFRQTGATIAYLMPDFQNPTGRLMSDPQREELVWICRRRGVTLIVDETLAEIVLETRAQARPVAALGHADAVISIGSLSKAVWAGLRVGWIRADPQQLAALARLRATADLGGAPVEQIAATNLLAELDELLASRRPQLRRQCDALARTVAGLGWRLELPLGGLSAWAELPEGSSSVLADVAYGRGLMLIPGPRLSPDGALDRYLRLPYAQPADVIRGAAGRLERAWSEARDQFPAARAAGT
jgi:DNA-binding transcriptional MocR family regulator